MSLFLHRSPPTNDILPTHNRTTSKGSDLQQLPIRVFKSQTHHRSNQNRESRVCEHALERKGRFDKRCHLLLLGLTLALRNRVRKRTSIRPCSEAESSDEHVCPHFPVYDLKALQMYVLTEKHAWTKDLERSLRLSGE